MHAPCPLAIAAGLPAGRPARRTVEAGIVGIAHPSAGGSTRTRIGRGSNVSDEGTTPREAALKEGVGAERFDEVGGPETMIGHRLAGA